MKVLIVLATICFGNQVCGAHQDSFIHENFDGSNNDLSETSDPHLTYYNCDADELVANSTQLAKTTLDLVAGTFSIVYHVVYPESGTGECPAHGLVCFIWHLNNGLTTIRDVKDNISTFKDNAVGVTQGILLYVHECLKKQ